MTIVSPENDYSFNIVACRLKARNLSQSGYPLLGNGSVSTVLYRCRGDNKTGSRDDAYITDSITEMKTRTLAVPAPTNTLATAA
jgi:hypothetical protein